MIQYIPFKFAGKKKMSPHTGLEPWSDTYAEALARRDILGAHGIDAKDGNTFWFDIPGPIVDCNETKGIWEVCS